MPGTGAPPRAARLSVAALFFLNGALFATWVSRIPAVQSKLGLNHGMLGLALLCIALGALAAMPTAGWCVSRFGSHRVTQFTAALFCAALPLPVLAHGTMSFMVALFVFGAGHGSLDVAMNAQAVAIEERYGRPIMSSFHALFSLGGLVGAASGGFIAATGLAPLVHFSTTATLLGVSAVLFAFPRLLDATASELAHLSITPDPSEKRSSFAWPSRALLALGIIAFCSMAGEGAMADWSAIFLHRIAGASEAAAAAGYAAFSIAMAIGRFHGDWLTMRLGPVNIVRISGALAAGGLALALVLGKPMPALIGFAAVGAGFATVVPQVFSAAGRTPGVSAGLSLATVTTVGYLGFLLGPPIIGLVAELLNLRTALCIIVLTSAVLIALAPSVGQRETAEIDLGQEA